MGTLAMALPQAPKPNLAELLKALVLPSRATQAERASETVDRTAEVVRGVISVIDELIAEILEKRTTDEFVAVRNLLFPQYYTAMRALGDLAAIVMSKPTLDRLSAEWCSELESDFRNVGPGIFGSDLAERGLFTAWTLRKIYDIAQSVGKASGQAYTPSDAEMSADFAAHAIWTRLHIDILVKAMRDGKPVYPGAMDPIRDGLRAAVNTYACIRQWADMRNPVQELDLQPIEWTDEDELLLQDSMRDYHPSDIVTAR